MNFDANIRYLKEEIEETAKKFLGRLFSGSDAERQRKVDILWSSIEQSPVHAANRRNATARAYMVSKEEIMKKLRDHMKKNPDSQRMYEVHHSKDQLDSGSVDEKELLSHAAKYGIKPRRTKSGGIILQYSSGVKIDPRIGRAFDPTRHGAEFSHLHPSGDWGKHVEEATKKYTKEFELPPPKKGSSTPYLPGMKTEERVKEKLKKDKEAWDEAKEIHNDEQRGFVEQHEKRKNSALEDHVQRIISHIEKFGEHNRVKRSGTKIGLTSPDIRHSELKKRHDMFVLANKHAALRLQKLKPEDENIRRLGDFIGGALNPRYAIRDSDPVSRKLGHYIANRLDSAVKMFSADLGPRSEPSAPAEDIGSEHAPR